MTLTRLLTQSALALALILGITTSHATEKVQCPAHFTPPQDSNAELSDEIKAEKLECMGAYIPMIRNRTYTIEFFNTYCSIAPGAAYGFTIRAKKPSVVSQKECERIGGFMQCHETVKKCFNTNDEKCSGKKKYCQDRLSGLEYDAEKDPSAGTNSEASQ